MLKNILVVLFSLVFISFSYAQLKIDPRIVVFDPTPVGDKSDKEKITVKNEGDERILIGDVDIVGGDKDDFDITNEDCEGEILSEGEECKIKVRFEPQSKGVKLSVLKFESATYRGGLELDFNENFVFLAGFGTESTDLEVDPETHEFKNMEVGDEETVIIRLKNKGDDTIKIKDYELKTLNLGKIVRTKKEEFEINENGGIRPCGTMKPTLDPNEYCTIEITFKPKKHGYKLAALLFETDEEDSPVNGVVFYGDVDKESDSDDGILGGCSFGNVATVPLYLVIPLLMLFRRFRA